MENILNYYRNEIYNFEYNMLSFQYHNSNNIFEASGYLINLKDYNELKELIGYNNYNQNMNYINYINSYEDIIPLKQIEFRNYDYIINMLLNGNEYILITPELWKVFCNKEKIDEPPTEYKIFNQQIIFSFKDNNQLILNLNDSKKFIIEKSSLNKNIIDYNSNYNIIEKIYNEIKSYYNFEKDFSIKLANDENYLMIEEYYLISKSWIKKWKLNSNYEIIKDIIDRTHIDDHNIKNLIIYFQKQFKSNYNIADLEIKDFKNKEEMEKNIRDNSFAIINKEFCSSFNILNPNCFLKYKIHNNIISINFGNDILSFTSKDNIISEPKINNLLSFNINDIKHLKQLLKIYFFQKEMKEKINISHNTSNNNEESNIYLIDKNIINKYKNHFQYSKLFSLLENNYISIKNLNYQNYESKLEVIMTNIKDYYINYYKSIQGNSNIQLNLNSNYFNVVQCPFRYNLKYVSNFEFINEEIQHFFIDNQIFGNEDFIKGKYIGEAGKIFIIFEYQNNNYYELGFFDSYGNLQIEYLIEELTKKYKPMILNYFKSFGIEYIYNNIFHNNNNILNFNNKYIGYFYKIEEYNKIHNDNNIENVQNYQSHKFILNILSSLISIYFFENDLINKMIESSENTFSNNISSKTYVKEFCYLINKDFISTLKKLFSYQEIEKIIKSNNLTLNSIINKSFLNKINENYLQNILNKQKDFEQFILNNQLLHIEKSTCKNNSKIIYPTNFNILNYDSYQKVLKICNIKENNIQNLPFYFGFNYGKIILGKFSKNSNLNNNNDQSLAYVVSLNYNDIDINYILEILFEFYGNFQDIDNTFIKIITGVDIIKSYTFNQNSFNKINNCKGYIINKTINQEIIKKENCLNYYLNYIIDLYNKYSILNKKINENISSSSADEEYEYYLINRKYMKDIESLLHFKEMSIIIKNVQSLNISLNIHETLRQQLQFQLYNSLIELNDETIKNKLKDKSSYLLSSFNDNNNESYYYNNCQIISKNIKDAIKTLDPNYFKNNNNCDFIKLVKCIFDKGKIIMFLNKKIINLGKLNEDNEFNIDYIIKLKNDNSFDTRFINIKKNGYDYIEKYIINANKKFTKTLDKNSIKLIEEYKISENLQTLIYIVIKQEKLIKSDILIENNKYQNIFLINKKWLLNYQYEKLCSLIQRDEKIKEFIGYNNSKKSIDWNEINYNISPSSMETLKEIDFEMKKINSLSHEPDEQYININNNKFFIPKEFIIVDEQIVELLKKNFRIQLSNTCDFFKKNDNIILKLNSKNIILLLNITNNTNSYNIKYIFEYNKNKEEEFNEICSKGIEEYMKQKTIFNENNINDCISPIFSGNNIIGNCYKYAYDYTNCINYSDYLSNENLQKVLKLYFYYNKLFEKINQKNNSEENYYLVNKDFINKIKNDYSYNEIKKLLKDNGINEENKNKKLLTIIKNQNNNFIKNYFEKDNLKNKYKEDGIEPDVIPINFKINDQQTYILINENFEIVSKDIIELFVGKVNENKNNYLKCTLQENKIIIYFPQIFGNKFFASLLGSLNNEDTFINEYILIYKDSSSQSKHKEKITNNIFYFINELQMNMINNSQPIIDEECKEIGITIKYENNIRASMINWTIEKFENNVNLYSQQEIVKNEEPNINIGKNYEHINNGLAKDDKAPLTNHFIFAPLIGLQNIGATCYMNATLQCFCHIEKFVRNFKYNQHIIDFANKDNKSLAYSFKLLIEKLWPDNYDDPYFNEKVFEPKEFKEKISKLNPLFKGIAANDAKDLVNFIIMTLHIELNIKPANSNNNDNVFLDQTNPTHMLQNFIKEFTSNNRSIISDLFYAMNCNITRCANCNVQIYNYQTYFFLVFPLEEVRKFKYNNYQYNFNNNYIANEVTIYDCFEYDRKINLMSGANTMYCNYCKRNSNCYICTNLITCPEILIILLNRGHGIEFNIKINFPEILNLYNYIELKNTGVNYQLIGVITHIGESSMSGHFIAYCKDPISTLWHKYNDAMVNEVSNFQNEVINFAMPYLLFYQKVQQ